MDLRKLVGITAFLAVCGASFGAETLGLNEILDRAEENFKSKCKDSKD